MSKDDGRGGSLGIVLLGWFVAFSFFIIKLAVFLPPIFPFLSRLYRSLCGCQICSIVVIG